LFTMVYRFLLGS